MKKIKKIKNIYLLFTCLAFISFTICKTNNITERIFVPLCYYSLSVKQTAKLKNFSFLQFSVTVCQTNSRTEKLLAFFSSYSLFAKQTAELKKKKKKKLVPFNFYSFSAKQKNKTEKILSKLYQQDYITSILTFHETNRSKKLRRSSEAFDSLSLSFSLPYY